MWKNSILFTSLAILSQAWAQEPPSPFRYESAGSLVLNSSLNLDWYENTFYYRWETPNGTSFYRGNVNQKQSEYLFSEEDVKLALTQKGIDGVKSWKLYRVEPATKKNGVKFSFKGQEYLYDWKQKTATVIAKKETKAPLGQPKKSNTAPYWQKFNADNSAYIFAKGNQLYLKKADKEIRLSDDGEIDFSFNSSANAGLDTVKQSGTNAVWAGDYIISWREDKRMIEDMSVVSSLQQPRPVTRTYKFPMPADQETAKYAVEIWDSKTLKKTKVDIIEEKDQRLILPGQLINGRTYLFASRLGGDEEGVYFLRRNRRNDEVELCRLHFASAKVEVLIKEKTAPHMNEQLFSVHVLDKSKDILFWSERTGFGKYYRYDTKGNLLNRVGPDGDYVAGGIHHFDTVSNALFIDVYGFQKANNPYLKQYLRVTLDQEGGKLLTDLPDVQHSITLSTNKRYFLDQYSSIGKAGVYELRDTSGSLIMHLGQADMSGLAGIGWRAPEQVKVRAADAKTDLYGLVYTPSDFDPAKKYPVISSVYPGPQDDFVPHSFVVDDNYHQSLADLGYVVVQLPSRGSSPYRGLKFHSYSYGNMRDYALEDNKSTLESLAKDRPYMDLERVGIFGHSGGGFMSATAILTYPKFYKVAVAASGNYDPNIYTQWWGETYHGLSPDGKKEYIPTAMELAANLEGKLLLITGDVDINVHPANTFRLANALIKANKYFDMMVLPGKDHGLGDAYYQNLIHNYFKHHLTKKNEGE
ncbi:MAG: S9 family peptidase [Sphingobacterium sp.]|jgi:dienelactone hydrolase|nr:S9 family peptidase [Sphingobacterium sp.]